MSSIKEIAAQAGVSITTVSKVLNNYSDVSENTKVRVREVAERLGYTPNMAARNLALKKSNIIGLVLPELPDWDCEYSKALKVLLGAKDVCIERDYELLIVKSSMSTRNNKNMSQLCREKQISGLLVYDLCAGGLYLQELAAAKLPYVSIDTKAGDGISAVITDYEAAVKELIELLHAKGHKHIGFINGPKDVEPCINKELGYRSAMREFGLTVKEGYVKYADHLEGKAFEKTIELIKENSEVTAIFCASDLMALGALRAIQSLRWRVPEYIALVGFDGSQLSECSNPRLTTVVQDYTAMGRAAADTLINILGGLTEEKIKYVSHSLRIRESI